MSDRIQVPDRVRGLLMRVFGVGEDAVAPQVRLWDLRRSSGRSMERPPESTPIAGVSAATLDHAEVVMALESEFSIEISDAEGKSLLSRTMTVEHLTRYVFSKLNAS